MRHAGRTFPSCFYSPSSEQRIAEEARYRQLKEQGSSNTAELEARAARLDDREAELKLLKVEAAAAEKATAEKAVHKNKKRAMISAWGRMANGAFLSQRLSEISAWAAAEKAAAEKASDGKEEAQT